MSDEVDFGRNKIYQLEDVLYFGKYKGETVEHVLGVDAKYLLWAQENVDFFQLDEEVLQAAEDKGNKSNDDTFDRFNRQ